MLPDVALAFGGVLVVRNMGSDTAGNTVSASCSICCTEKCGASLLLSGAPEPQIQCNGFYTKTSEQVDGHSIYRKQDPGQDVRYVYWHAGQMWNGWRCDDDKDPRLIRGRLPIAVETPTRSIFAKWWAGSRWVVATSEIQCKGLSHTVFLA